VLLVLLTLAADACWIAFDVWGFIVTTSQLPLTEWYLFVVFGGILVGLTVMVGVLQFRKDRREKKLRDRYEWSLPTPRQRSACTSLIGRTGKEEFGERRVRFSREPVENSIKITDELVLIFREAGFDASDADIHEAEGIIRSGIWIDAPEGHPSVEPIIRGLTMIFGEFDVHHRPVANRIHPYLDRATTISILIGRKPVRHVS
jgi:hypothetical protein